jgi:hypothetical protein
VLDLSHESITVELYLSESDSQTLAAAIKQGRGAPALLRAFAEAFRGIRFSVHELSNRFIIRKEYEEGEDFAVPLVQRIQPGVLRALHRTVRGWLMWTLAEWVRGART